MSQGRICQERKPLTYNTAIVLGFQHSCWTVAWLSLTADVGRCRFPFQLDRKVGTIPEIRGRLVIRGNNSKIGHTTGVIFVYANPDVRLFYKYVKEYNLNSNNHRKSTVRTV